MPDNLGWIAVVGQESWEMEKSGKEKRRIIHKEIAAFVESVTSKMLFLDTLIIFEMRILSSLQQMGQCYNSQEQPHSQRVPSLMQLLKGSQVVSISTFSLSLFQRPVTEEIQVLSSFLLSRVTLIKVFCYQKTC